MWWTESIGRTMLNTPEAYRQAGHATATARRQGDEARAARAIIETTEKATT